MFIGLFGGVGLCFVFEYFDNTVKNPEDIEELTGVPSLGIVPHFSPEAGNKAKSGYYSRYRYGEEKEKNAEEVLVDAKNIELINHLYPKLSIAEDYRTIRTSILLSRAGNPPKTILVSSSLPKEGKSVTTSNLAISFAQLKKKVVVVDTDLRRPRLHKIFDVSNAGGVSTFLSRASSMKDDLVAMVLESGIENIWVLPGGPIPPNPAELLNSQNMEDLLDDLKENFDVILLDTPPILSVIDGVILASKVDSVLLVVHVGKTTRKDFINTVESLKRANGRLMGTVFNWMELNSHSFGYMHYYPYYGSRDSE
jgi:capsular exopolysaccharide synthesis family protein